MRISALVVKKESLRRELTRVSRTYAKLIFKGKHDLKKVTIKPISYHQGIHAMKKNCAVFQYY